MNTTIENDATTNSITSEVRENNPEYTSFYAVHTVVDVMPRLWPGINKPGGVGRVTGVHQDEGKLLLSIITIPQLFEMVINILLQRKTAFYMMFSTL